MHRDGGEKVDVGLDVVVGALGRGTVGVGHPRGAVRRDLEVLARLCVCVCVCVCVRVRERHRQLGHCAAAPFGSDTPGVPCAATLKYSRACDKESYFTIAGRN